MGLIHEWLIFMGFHAGKYTVRPMYPSWAKEWSCALPHRAIAQSDDEDQVSWVVGGGCLGANPWAGTSGCFFGLLLLGDMMHVIFFLERFGGRDHVPSY